MSTVVGPAMVTALMAARLRDADEALSRKLNAANVQVGLGTGGRVLTRSRFNLTERRVLALVRAARAMTEGPDPAPLNPTNPLAPGPSRFAVLGSAGFELPAYADMLSAFPAWRARVMRSGSEQPFHSLVEVPTSPFLHAVGAQTVSDAGADAGAVRRAEAFTMGLAAALAHETITAPLRRGSYARRTAKPWSHGHPASAVQADVTASLRRLLGGPDPVATYLQWWPTEEQARPLLDGYVKALEATFGLRVRTTTANEAVGVGGPELTEDRAAAGYGRLVSDQVPWTMGEWFGVLTPILLAPALTVALGGALLPGMGAFLTASTVTERSISELISLGDALNSITPFIASMVMWANLPDQPTEPFVSALWTFLARVGLTAGWFPTIGSATNDPSPGARWGLAGANLGLDVYQLVRWLAARGDRQPGPAVLFGLQNVTAIMTVVTLVQAGLAKGMVALAKEAGADDEAAAITGWVTMGATAVGLWLGAGLPAAKALSRGGGWMSWFTSDLPPPPPAPPTPPVRPSLRGAVVGARAEDTMDAAAVFDDSSLWRDPAVAAPGLADLRYPTGGRPLVKVWRAAGSPALEISPRGNAIVVRDGATETSVPIAPSARTVADLVTALTAVPGVLAAAADAEVGYDLPWPVTVARASDDADPRPPAGDPAHTAFVPIPDDEHHPYLLRHASDEAVASRFGASGPGRSPFDGLRGVPRASLGDADDTVLGTSADLAVLLGLGMSSRLRTVTPLTPAPDPALVPAPPAAVAAPIGPVAQVFRRWNLDHRRVNEWRTIVTGGAAPEGPFPADATLSAGAQVAHAMGWVPLWRAWLRVAADAEEDTAATTVSTDTPFVRSADGTVFRPTNAQLTAAVRYMLDLDP